MERLTDKPELRERIVATATKLFQQHGIKHVRMDDVASELGISKRTLYGVFADKEAILLEVVKLTSEAMSQGIMEIVSSGTNVIEQIFMLYKRVIEYTREVNELFFVELIRYTEVEAYFAQNYVAHMECMKAWLQQGVEQGLLRDDINDDVFLRQDGFQIDKLMRNSAVRTYEPKVIYNSVVLVLLRGMATEKGMSVVEKLNIENKN